MEGAVSQTGTRALPGRCFRPCLASEPAKVGLGPLGSGIVESRVSQALGGGGGREESCQFLPCGPWGQTPKGHWQFPVVDHPLPTRTNSDSVRGWRGKKEESRSIRAGYLAVSCIRTEIERIVMERGCCILGQVSFCSWLKRCVCVLTVPFLLL